MIRLALILLLVAPQAQAHDWWTGLRNAKGEICCGGEDCRTLADEDVLTIHGGYYIRSLRAFVPNAEAAPGKDPEHFSVCVWGGERKCFFVPTPSY